jgi:hypothetical protein
MSINKLCFFIILVSFLSVGNSEMIFLKDGQIINGEIKGFNNGIYTVETKYGTLQIDNNQIFQIKYDTSSLNIDSQIKQSMPEIIQSTKSVSISTFSGVSENVSLNTTNLKILTGKRIKLARGFRIGIYDNKKYEGYIVLNNEGKVIDENFNILDGLVKVYDEETNILTDEIEIRKGKVFKNTTLYKEKENNNSYITLAGKKLKEFRNLYYLSLGLSVAGIVMISNNDETGVPLVIGGGLLGIVAFSFIGEAGEYLEEAGKSSNFNFGLQGNKASVSYRFN